MKTLLAFLFLVLASAQAQVPGTVTGHVQGPGGVSVPGATVLLVNPQSGERKVTWTDEAGNYALVGVNPGTYRLEVSLVGFHTDVHEPVAVAAGQALKIDAALLLALPQQANAGAAASPPAGRGTPRQPSSLPPAAQERIRQYARQAGAAGSMAGAMSGNTEGNVRFTEPSLGGETAGSTDGQPGGAANGGGGEGEPGAADTSASAANSFLLSGSVEQAPTPGDAQGRGRGGMQDFRNGQGGGPGFGGGGGGGGFGGPGGGGGFGGPGGGGFGGGMAGFGGGRRPQVNRVRGNLSEDFSNSAFNARPYALNAAPAPQIAYYQERFGGSIGGPLAIPKIYNGKDKASFFVNYQLQRGRNPFSSFATVPTLDERQGNFSQAVIPSGPLAGTVPVIYDPSSNPAGPRTAFANNQIPAIDAAALGLLPYIPKPNLPGSVQNFRLQESLPSDSDRVMGRIGYKISDKDNLSAMYYFNSMRSQSVGSFPELTSSLSTRQQNMTLGETHNFTSHFINSLTVTFNRQRSSTLNPFAYQQDIASELGIQSVSENPFDWGLPIISFTNYTGLNDTIPSLNRNQTFRVVDSVLWNHGKHNVRFGGELRRVQQNSLTDPDARGTFNFTGYTTSDFTASGQPVPGTGLDFADFLLGLPQVTSERFGTSSNYLRSWVYAGFVQDDWRATARLTFNAGLRYEFFEPFVEKYGHLSDYLLGPDFSSVSVVTGQSPDGLAPSLIKSDPHLFSPRLGMAFRPWTQHSFVMRAGYGIFYDGSIYSRLVRNLVDQPPFAQASTLITSPSQVLTLEDGFPTVAAKVANNTYAVDPNFRVPYGQTWTFTLEDQVFRNVILSVGYVGTKGTKLDLLLAPNEALTGQAALQGLQFKYETDGASSLYNGLQVSLRRQFHNGFSLSGNYTYSKSIDNAASVGGAGSSVAQDLYDLQAERGLSVFDVRHRFLVNWNYEFPFGERRRWLNRGGALAGLLGNWQISGYGQVQSGTPYTALLQGNQSNNAGGGAFFSERADATGQAVSLPGSERTTLDYFNTGAFTLPPTGQFGDAGRNTILGPGTVNFNTSLDRFVTLNREKGVRLDFRISANNLFNTPNFGGLATVVNAVNFGRVTSVRSMRTMDFSLRLRF